MSLVVNLSLMGMVVAFMVGVLVRFPVPDNLLSSEADGNAYAVDSVQEASDMFSGSYMALVDEIIAYQNTPDFEKADVRLSELRRSGGLSFWDKIEALSERLSDLPITSEKGTSLD